MTEALSGVLETAEAVRNGRVSATDVARSALSRIAAKNDGFNCFTAVYTERALAEAQEIDILRSKGGQLGPLAGVPYGVKNLFDVADLPTLAGSIINAGRVPATSDATMIQRLRSAGAVLVGALNMDEYARGLTTENSHYGPTRNPHNLSCTAGGSSGGSAAAVAGGLVPFSLGSDTNGSVRVPASLCGVFGFKPTYGRLSRAGMYPYATSFDHVGLFSRSVGDLALVYDVLQGPDKNDRACTSRAPEPAFSVYTKDPTHLRIAVAGDYFEKNAEPEAIDAVAIVSKVLQPSRRIVIPEAARAQAAANVISGAEGGSVHLDHLKTRAGDFDPLTRDRFIAGALTPASWYLQAQRFRVWFHAAVLELFKDIDVLLAPATPRSATKIGQDTMTIGGVEVPARASMGIFTRTFSFIGFPVVVVPIHRHGRMPIGVQIVAAPWKEVDCLRIAAKLQAAGVAAAPVA